MGPVEFLHWPTIGEDWCFSFCRRCNRTKRKLRIEFHEGIVSDWIKVICPSCDKTIWVAELTSDEEDMQKGFKRLRDEGRVLIKDNAKCAVCKKPTNYYDCAIYRLDDKYFCSERCEREYDKRKCKLPKRKSKRV